MFNTLESNWDQSARRGWTTLASFTMQALALSLLLAVSLIWVGGPPQVRWLRISAPAAFTPPPAPATQAAREQHTSVAASVLKPQSIVAPASIPDHVAPLHDARASATDAPSTETPSTDAPSLDYGQGHGRGLGVGIARSIGDGIPMVVPARPVAVRPLLVSHLAEANLLHKVQPVYPPLARQARIQGGVELRAIIGKTGAIENLVVVRGHPMLAPAAVEAVKQWRYRPYLLNGEPIAVETDITVNFLLSGG
jgi:protein TonB